MPPTLAESVIGGAQQAAQGTGKTIGDAMQAYHIVSTAENARQQLDIQKQENERNKATWVAQQIQGIGAASGNSTAQKILAKSFGEQAPKVLPGLDPDIAKLLEDPQIARLQAISSGRYLAHGGSDEVHGKLWDMLQDKGKFIAAVQKEGEEQSKITAAAVSGQAQKATIMRDNQTSAAVDHITKDPQVLDYSQRSQGATRILGQLDEVKAGRMVDTSQFLGDLSAEYTNLLTNSKNPALGIQERTEYKTNAAKWAGFMQQIDKDPTSINSPKILSQIETGVRSMQSTYHQSIANRATLLRRVYPGNPAATQEQDHTIGTLGQQFPVSAPASVGQQQTPQPAPQQQAASSPQQSPNAHLGRDEMIQKVMQKRAAEEKAKRDAMAGGG